MIRRALLRVPVLGRWVERRWMTDPIERDAHYEIVRERLEAPTITPAPSPMPADEPLPAQVTEPAAED